MTMTLEQIKRKFQAWLRLTAQRLAAAGVTASQVTLASAAGSLVVGALTGGLAWLPVVFLLMPLWQLTRLALDDIEGMLGRGNGQSGVLGTYLGELGDIVSDLALVIPFAAIMPSGGGEVVLFAILALVVECAGLIGPLAGASRRHDGPLGKRQRALALGALGLWFGLGLGLGRFGHLVWIVLSLLGVLTIVNRVRRGVQEARESDARRPS